MICPNCGRRNSAGATFCSRCHQRLPLATKLNGNHRRMFMVEPRGGGGGGAIVLGVALLAGLLFIGGAAAIYLSNPPGSANPTDIALASGSSTLPPFVQTTASPMPSASPTFILLPSDSTSPSFSPLPTDTGSNPTIAPTQQPTASPRTPQVAAKFTWSQVGATLMVNFRDTSTGKPTQWQWDFGKNEGTSNEQSPNHEYMAYGEYKVTLIVTGANGSTSFKQRTIVVQAPQCDDTGNPPGCITPMPTVEPPPPAETPTPFETTAP